MIRTLFVSGVQLVLLLFWSPYVRCVFQALMIKLGHFGSEAALTDEAEIQCHQQLQNLYNSTRAAKVESRWFFSSMLFIYEFEIM